MLTGVSGLLLLLNFLLVSPGNLDGYTLRRNWSATLYKYHPSSKLVSHLYIMVKQLVFATRVPRHVQLDGWPCGTWMHYAMRDVKDMGQKMGYRSH